MQQTVPNKKGWRAEVDRLIQEWADENDIVMDPSTGYATNPRYRGNPLLEKTFSFGVDVLDFAETLLAKQKFDMARQLISSGTSIGANSREAQNAESKADFVHKIKVALKEADETEYWLLLCTASPHYPDGTALLESLHPIIKILNSILSTCKRNKK